MKTKLLNTKLRKTKFGVGVAVLAALTPILSGCHSSEPAPQTTPSTSTPEADAAASRGQTLPSTAPGPKAAAPR